LAKAAQSGADVKEPYDKQNFGPENIAMASKAGIQAVCRERSGNKSEKHSKFLVLLETGSPAAVWTGSTNISAGRVFGHSNIGHYP
jgi:hypothetical protein